MEGFKEIVIVIAIVLGVILGLGVPALIPTNYFLHQSCSQRAETLGYGSDYGFIKGCFWILPDGRIVPAGTSYTVITR